MSLDNFFHPDLKETDQRVLLSASEAHHARKVLRNKNGQEVCVFNGFGVKARGNLLFHGSSDCGVEIHSIECFPEPTMQPVLVLAVPENKDTFHEILRGAVQLGSGKIILLNTRYCGLRRSGNTEKVLEKCRRIIVNACKQSGQVWMPELLGPMKIQEFLNSADSNSPIIMGVEPERTVNESALKIDELNSKYFYWMVGPEGGWSDEELDLIERNIVCSIRIGSLTLTTKTAAIAGLACLLTRFKCW